MDWFRLRHTIGMYKTLSATKRAEYIKKHKIFSGVGNNCMFMFRKIPLYPDLIKIHNNVWIASNVLFLTHDVIHKMLNNKGGSNIYQERIGCIEIEDNVFIGANSTILYDVKICKNVIIGAGSLVNKDISKSGVYAGVPAKYICSVEDYENKLKSASQIEVKRGKRGLTEETINQCWERFYNSR